jgi:hypothetical protein
VRSLKERLRYSLGLLKRRPVALTTMRERGLCEQPKGEATIQPRTPTTPISFPNHNEREDFVSSLKERLQNSLALLQRRPSCPNHDEREDFVSSLKERLQ